GGYQGILFTRDPRMPEPRFEQRAATADLPVNGVYRAGSDHRKDGQAVGWGRRAPRQQSIDARLPEHESQAAGVDSEPRCKDLQGCAGPGAESPECRSPLI